MLANHECSLVTVVKGGPDYEEWFRIVPTDCHSPMQPRTRVLGLIKRSERIRVMSLAEEIEIPRSPIPIRNPTKHWRQ